MRNISLMQNSMAIKSGPAESSETALLLCDKEPSR